MIRRLLSVLVITIFFCSCNNSPKNEAKNDASGAAKVEFAALAGNPDEYIGKDISVEGKVVHVCMESGKKLFIVGENPDVRLYIQAGENMPKFPTSLLGSTVVVEGKLTRIASMQAGEGAMHAGSETAMKHEGMMAADSCETETALAAQTVLADVMMEYKSHIVK